MYTTAITRDSWWALVSRGTVAVLFGIVAVFWPGLTLPVLVYLFSAYLLVSGVLGLVTGAKTAEKSTWWVLHVLLGVVELGFGIYLVRHPSVTLGTFLLLTGFVLVVRGLFEVVATFLERDMTGVLRSVNSVSGLVSLVAGIVLVLYPRGSGVSFVWLLGLYAIVLGALVVSMCNEVNRVAAAANGSRRRV